MEVWDVEVWDVEVWVGMYNNVFFTGRKEIAKFNSKTEDSEGENHKSHEEEKEEGRGSNISRGLCTVWNLMTSLTRDLLLGPPTNISDCLNAFFGPSELKGTEQD